MTVHLGGTADDPTDDALEVSGGGQSVAAASSSDGGDHMCEAPAASTGLRGVNGRVN